MINNDSDFQLNFPNDVQPGERFVPITNFQVKNIKDYYLISNYGRVFNKYKNTYNNLYISSGYYRVNLQTNYGSIEEQVHRLVLKCHSNLQRPIIPIYDLNHKLDVNHKDGNKLNNNIDNLEWCTRSENILHAYRTGLHPKGINSSLTKIHNESIIIKICELIQAGYTNKDIVNYINNPNVTISVCQDIRSGHGWKEFSSKYNFYRRQGHLFTNKEIENICLYFQKYPKENNISINEYCRYILNLIGYDSSNKTIDCVRKIYNKKYYTNISSNYNF